MGALLYNAVIFSQGDNFCDFLHGITNPFEDGVRVTSLSTDTEAGTELACFPVGSTFLMHMSSLLQ